MMEVKNILEKIKRLPTSTKILSGIIIILLLVFFIFLSGQNIYYPGRSGYYEESAYPTIKAPSLPSFGLPLPTPPELESSFKPSQPSLPGKDQTKIEVKEGNVSIESRSAGWSNFGYI